MKDSNLRSFRDGFTVPRLQACDQRKRPNHNDFRAYSNKQPTSAGANRTLPGARTLPVAANREIDAGASQPAAVRKAVNTFHHSAVTAADIPVVGSCTLSMRCFLCSALLGSGKFRCWGPKARPRSCARRPYYSGTARLPPFICTWLRHCRWPESRRPYPCRTARWPTFISTWVAIAALPPQICPGGFRNGRPAGHENVRTRGMQSGSNVDVEPRGVTVSQAQRKALKPPERIQLRHIPSG